MPFNISGLDQLPEEVRKKIFGDRDSGGSQKKDYKVDSNSIMTLIGSWGSFKFYIKKKSMIGVKDFGVTVSNETETKSTNSKENYTSIKNSNPFEVTVTGIFSRILGLKDVRATAWKLMDIVRTGKKFYVYLGAEKVAAPLMVGTNAKTNKIEIGPDKKMNYCEVQLTLKQCEKWEGGTAGTIEKNDDSDGYDSGGSGGGSGGGGGSGKKGKRSSGKKQPTTPSKYPDSGTQRHRSRGDPDDTRKGAAEQSIKDKLGDQGKKTPTSGPAPAQTPAPK